MLLARKYPYRAPRLSYALRFERGNLASVACAKDVAYALKQFHTYFGGVDSESKISLSIGSSL
jgi:hypothetical protein